jgi:hypothetical protein
MGAIFSCNEWSGQMKDIHKILRFWNQLSRPGGKKTRAARLFMDKLIFNK